MDSAKKGVFVSEVEGWKLFSENHDVYKTSNINALNGDIDIGEDDMEGEIRYLLFRLDDHVGFW